MDKQKEKNFMTVSGEAFSRRLESYSDDTSRLISSFKIKKFALQALEIVATTDTEEEVVQKLHQLKKKDNEAYERLDIPKNAVTFCNKCKLRKNFTATCTKYPNGIPHQVLTQKTPCKEFEQEVTE